MNNENIELRLQTAGRRLLTLKNMKKILLILGIILGVLTSVYAQQLPRKGWLGAKIEMKQDTIVLKSKTAVMEGFKVLKVVGGTAKAILLQENDIIVKIDTNTFKSTLELQQFITSKMEGDPIKITIIRDGKIKNLNGKMVGKPRETNERFDVIYESVPFRGGTLSIIINKPKKTGKLPAMLFIPGYTCSSIDGLSENHPYGRIVRAYADSGYVVLRVEKSGLGDSQNTVDCSLTNLYDEVANFQAGLDKLRSLDYVDTNQIFIFGHSMGGVIAPALGAQNNVCGVIVYGTTAKSFFEYQLEMNRLQIMLAKPDPFEYEKTCRLQTEIAYEYYILKKDIKEIASTPERIEALKKDWEYDGNNKIFGRNQEYWRQIVDFPLLEYWKNCTGKVLVLYGGTDFQAFSKADHEQIVYTVNYYHPNQATLIIFPETDHYLAKSGTMQNAFDLFAQGKTQTLFDLFDFEVITKSIEWSNNIVNSE
jgi:uncharacterized protein